MTDETTQAEAPADEAIVDTPAVDLDAEPEKEEAEGKTDEAKPDEPKPEEEDGEPEDKPKKLSGAQRAKLREARLQSELESLRAQIQPKQDETKPPKEEDFNGDYFAWQRALTAHDVKQAIREENRQNATQRHQSLQQQEAMENAIEHAERVVAARSALPDFDQVMSAAQIPIRGEVSQEILSSEKSALIAYHLAKNPDKLQAMNNMSARELAREVGRLEATVRLPSPKKQTSAPAPLSALRGGASPSNSDSDLNAWLKKHTAKGPFPEGEP